VTEGIRKREALEESAAAALAGTLEEVVAPVEEVTTADCRISGSAEGAAAGMLAAMSTLDSQPVGEVDSTQVQVGVDPSWSAAAKESYLNNERCLWGVEP
jgi:hypothetical protein